VGSVEGFSLPNPCGRGGGACTSTLLNVLYKDHQDTAGDLTFTEVMEKMRVILKEKNFEQIPQVRKCMSIYEPAWRDGPFDLLAPFARDNGRFF
jgi:hypothetical protein